MTGVPVTLWFAVATLLGATWVFVANCRRAARDWPFAMRCVIALDRLAALDDPIAGFELAEVRLVDAYANGGPVEVRVAQQGAGGGPECLILDEPRPDLLAICTRWQLEETPLLLAICDQGAVLYGPGIQLLGSVAGRTEIEWLGSDGRPSR